MSIFGAQCKPGEMTLSAVVTRADGSVEDLGVIAHYKYTAFGRLAQLVRGKLRKEGA